MNHLIENKLEAKNIELIDNIWYSKGKSEVSYPDEGNSIYYQLEDNSFWFKHRNAIIISVMKKFPPAGSLFDIGGGNGFVSKTLQDNGIDTFLVEPGIKGIKNAEKRGVKNLICSTLEDAQFQNGSIPAIGIFDVLEHIENDINFLMELSAYLKPEGMLYITVPAYELLWTHEDIIAGHYRRYNLRKISDILQQAGFKVLFKSYFFSFLPVPILLFRSLPFKLGFRKKMDQPKLSDEHSQKKGVSGRILDIILKLEKGRLENLKRILFGGSCIIVAKK